MPGLPSGTITFLFTDIEGSTSLWERHPVEMGAALARHDTLMRDAIERHGGHVFKTMGDAFCAAFHTAPEALEAALTAQLNLSSEVWPDDVAIRVRMALHTGAAEIRDEDYFGQPLNRVARLLGAGHGGQVLLSLPTQELTRDSLPSEVNLQALGEHRLRDLIRPETIFQLLHPKLPAEFPPIKALGGFPNNLPQQLTAFIGREKEIAEVTDLLSRSRLLTLVGSGGCGKTRLSLQVAANVLEKYPDGVFLVELAPLTDLDRVPQTVASILGVTEQAGKEFTQALAEFLASKRLLLILDNCEHLLSACAALSNALVRSCSQVTILASSREAMGISGERAYRVPSLSSPDPLQTFTVETINQYEAVRLFIECAQFHRSEFGVTNQNAAAVASVCHRLDGIPLAIELAAARIRSLSVEDIDTRLRSNFQILTGGSKTALPRQQTLRALIDWSYDLLNDQEKLLLRRLSVFSGGWTLEAAEQIGAGESASNAAVENWEVLDLLSSLADKSLVIVDTHGVAPRYRMLVTVRHYARDRMIESGEQNTTKARHRDYYLDLAESIRPKLDGPDQAMWLTALEEEHDNFRAALAFCQQEPSIGEMGLRLATALATFWSRRGYLSEGRQHLSAILSGTIGLGHSTHRASALYDAGGLAYFQGEFAASRDLLDDSLTIYRDLSDKRGIIRCLIVLGLVESALCNYAASQSMYSESLELARELGDKRHIAYILGNLGCLAHTLVDFSAARDLHNEALTIFQEMGNKFGVAATLGNLAQAASAQGDYPAADALNHESLAVYRELEHKVGIAVCLNSLGNTAHSRADYASAQTYQQESLAIRRDIGDRRGIADSLFACAELAAVQDQTVNAAQLYAAAERLRGEIEAPIPPSQREEYDRKVSDIRMRLGDDAFASAWLQGINMSLEQAIELAMQPGR